MPCNELAIYHGVSFGNKTRETTSISMPQCNGSVHKERQIYCDYLKTTNKRKIHTLVLHGRLQQDTRSRSHKFWFCWHTYPSWTLREKRWKRLKGGYKRSEVYYELYGLKLSLKLNQNNNAENTVTCFRRKTDRETNTNNVKLL